jgi:arylmalonate decarboxylase
MTSNSPPKTTGVKRVALATAYIDDFNARLVAFLQAEGLGVTGVEGLAMTDVRGVREVRPKTLMSLAERVFQSNKSAQGLLSLVAACSTSLHP